MFFCSLHVINLIGFYVAGFFVCLFAAKLLLLMLITSWFTLNQLIMIMDVFGSSTPTKSPFLTSTNNIQRLVSTQKIQFSWQNKRKFAALTELCGDDGNVVPGVLFSVQLPEDEH